MNIIVRKYTKDDVPDMIEIWNAVVNEGIAFPQDEPLTFDSGILFFNSQSYCGVAADKDTDKIYGLYILHPNNIGRCGHISNASYAVCPNMRGKHIGRSLVLDSIEKGKELGFGVLQFNAVVETNAAARHLYESLGFVQLGTIPNGFKTKDGHFENICPYYHTL